MRQAAFDAFYQSPVVELSAPVQTQGSLRSRHSSAMGAQAVQPKVAEQMARVYAAYQKFGALCDTEVELKTGIQRSSIIPRRRELQKLGLVKEIGHRKNPQSGVSNTTFGVAKAE